MHVLRLLSFSRKRRRGGGISCFTCDELGAQVDQSHSISSHLRMGKNGLGVALKPFQVDQKRGEAIIEKG